MIEIFRNVCTLADANVTHGNGAHPIIIVDFLHLGPGIIEIDFLVENDVPS